MRTRALALARRQDERRLGQVELQRDGLHRRIVEPPSVFDDREGISAETLFGEHVDDAEAVVRMPVLFRRVGADSRCSTAVRTSRASASKSGLRCVGYIDVEPVSVPTENWRSSERAYAGS